MGDYVKVDDIIKGLRDDELVMLFSLMSADERVGAFMRGLKKECSVFSNAAKTDREE